MIDTFSFHAKIETNETPGSSSSKYSLIRFTLRDSGRTLFLFVLPRFEPTGSQKNWKYDDGNRLLPAG